MVHLSRFVRRRLGEILIEEGVLKEEQVREGLRRQKATGELLGEALVTLGCLAEQDIARAIVRQFGLPYLDASRYHIFNDVVSLVPRELMWQNSFVVLDKIGKTLIVAMSGLMNVEILEKIEKLTGLQLFVYVSTASQVRQTLERHAPLNGHRAGKK